MALSSAAVDRPAGPSVVACMKLVDHRPSVDPLTGVIRTDVRSAGPSPADEAALEWALRLGEAWELPTTAISAGGPAVEPMLRGALAAGVNEAVRVDFDPTASSAQVAAAVAASLRGRPCLVLCGAWSLDRGSGSFPAFLAAQLHCAQALGLIGLDVDPDAGRSVRALRRLDGGRRERLACPLPAVLSLEASTARLRRASLDGILAARTAAIRTEPAPAPAHPEGRAHAVPFRPRARVLDPPRSPSARDRVLALTGAAADRPPSRVLTLDPGPAADAILEQLRAWGYRP